MIAKRRRGPVAVTCLSCGWSLSAGTWRPAKRALAAHTAQLQLHRDQVDR